MGTFSRQIEAFAASARKDVERAARLRMTELFGRIVDMTPVAGGRAKGNWICTLGAPATGESGQPDRDGSVTKRRIAGILESFGFDDGRDVFLVNNTPYIEELEYGHSDQAPAGMVRLSVRAATERL